MYIYINTYNTYIRYILIYIILIYIAIGEAEREMKMLSMSLWKRRILEIRE